MKKRRRLFSLFLALILVLGLAVPTGSPVLAKGSDDAEDSDNPAAEAIEHGDEEVEDTEAEHSEDEHEEDAEAEYSEDEHEEDAEAEYSEDEHEEDAEAEYSEDENPKAAPRRYSGQGDEYQHGLGDNVHSGEGVAQSLWYTKLIDLNAFPGRDIKGTLRFKLSPYEGETKSYDLYKPEDLEDPEENSLHNSLTVEPGVEAYEYTVPFSSEDFVDPEFNRLAKGSAFADGDSVELFNYALLHEWGRMFSSDHVQTARVGKLEPCQFDSPEAYEEAKRELRSGPYGKRASWPGDPDSKEVVGWRCFHELEAAEEEAGGCFLGSYEDGCQNLMDYHEFRDGTLDYVQKFNLQMNPSVTYYLGMITRPIALSKDYDEEGNIQTIEKPLLPSKEAFQLLRSYDDIDYDHKIFRYSLEEQYPDDLKLEPAKEQLIVDVIPWVGVAGSVYIFENEAEADQFYQNRAKEIQADGSSWDSNRFYLSDSKPIQFGNTWPSIELSVRQLWEDGDNQDGIRPKSVEVKLLADGGDTGKRLTLSEENEWKGQFKKLSKNDPSSGKRIIYSVEEEAPADYEVTIAADPQVIGRDAEGFVITNSHSPETIEITGSKTWDDEGDQAGKRPESITIRLWKNCCKEVESKTISAKEDWKWSFTDLPKYDKGREVCYRITEDAVKDYSTEIDHYDIVNRYTPGKTSILVAKFWEDNDDREGKRPDSITVRLFADGKATGKLLILNEENDWMDSFTGLDEMADGQAVKYTVKEKKVGHGYKGSISGNPTAGFHIVNRLGKEEDNVGASNHSKNPNPPANPSTKPPRKNPNRPTKPPRRNPSTGVDFNMGFWVSLLGFATVAGVAVQHFKRKEENER